MRLREKLRQKSEIELAGITRDAGAALEGLHPAVTGEEVAKLAFGTRTATLEKAVIGRMISAMEDEIVENYSSQFNLVLDPKDDKKDSL